MTAIQCSVNPILAGDFDPKAVVGKKSARMCITFTKPRRKKETLKKVKERVQRRQRESLKRAKREAQRSK